MTIVRSATVFFFSQGEIHHDWLRSRRVQDAGQSGNAQWHAFVGARGARICAVKSEKDHEISQ